MINIYGASGHGKVIFDIARSQNVRVLNIIDDNPDIKEFLNLPVHHSVTSEIEDVNTVLAIGNNRIRYNVANKLNTKFAKPLIHTSAIFDPSTTIGNGTVVMANSVINAHSIIGKHCIINSGAVVEHDCNLEDFVHISPNAAIAGGVNVGKGTHIGIGSVVIPGMSIGKWVTVGAGAVIIKDIPDFAVVVGNPGKIIKYVEVND